MADVPPSSQPEPSPVAPVASGGFWQAVTNDLHLTFSGLIVFACVLGSIWLPDFKEKFGATAAAAGIYLTGRATAK